jgi:phosphoglycolate phosphatase
MGEQLKFKYLIFDFDGTIADTFHEIVNIYNEIAPDFNARPVDDELLLIIKSRNPREIMKNLKVSIFKVPMMAVKAIALLKQRINTIRLIKGINTVLKKLKDKGYMMSIVSSNAYDNINAFLEKNNLKFFDHIYFSHQIFAKHKVINSFIKDNRINKKDIIYIGDEARDIKAAKKAGIKIISVTWGYNDRSVLSELKPDYIVDKPEELIEILE